MEDAKRYIAGLFAGAESGMVKVAINVVIGESVGVENLWAKPLSDGLLQIENIPFFTDECCIGDTVEVDFDGYGEIAGEGNFKYLRTVEKVTQKVTVAYEIEGQTHESLAHKLNVWAKAMNEHNLHAEPAVAGILVVATPYGEVSESLEVIRKSAETANLEIIDIEA